MPNFIIEHQCPQCGAPAELAETDRLFQCGFCRVSSFLSVPDVFHYLLPHNAPSGKELIYFPYWRFKGMLFACVPGDIKHRFVDVSQQAVHTPAIPFSLGFRSQTQRLRFATGDLAGTFIKPDHPRSVLIDNLNTRFCSRLSKPVLHQAQIGETLSLIYAPYYMANGLVDAILNQPVPTGGAAPIEALLEKRTTPAWPITFVPSLCPQCGWDMQGQSDALTLSCENCDTLWRAKGGHLAQLPCAHAADEKEIGMYMPFWRIRADVDGIALKSHADLIRTANLPRVVQPGLEQQTFYFWCPAFKLNPQRFLTCASHVTGSQPRDPLTPGPPRGRRQAVNMPLSEAVESLKLIIALFAKPRERIDEILETVTIRPRKFLLVYLPFQEGHHEFIHRKMNLAIYKNLLVHAKNL